MNMGKTVTPKYRLVVWDGKSKSVMSWRGQATGKRLENWIHGYINSLKPRGSNYHLSKSLGYMPIPNKANIVNQKTNTVVASWKAPKFMII